MKNPLSIYFKTEEHKVCMKENGILKERMSKSYSRVKTDQLQYIIWLFW